MVEKDQKMRYNRKELSVIASAFKNNHDLLYSLRRFMWQMDMSEEEFVNLKKQCTPELIDVLKKDLVAGKEYEVPFNMTFDPYVFKETTTYSVDDLYSLVDGKMLIVEYFEKQLDELGTGEKNQIVLEDMKPKKGQDKVERYVNLYAYSVIISVTEKALSDYKVTSQIPEDLTDEEKADKKKKDSNR